MASTNLLRPLMQDFNIFKKTFNFEDFCLEKNIALALPNLDHDIPSQTTSTPICSSNNGKIHKNKKYNYNSNIIIFSTVSDTPDFSKILNSLDTNDTFDL